MSDISELFQRDPKKISREELERMVEEYRKKRAQFNLGNLQAGRAKPTKTTAKQEEASKVVGELSLDKLL